MVSKYHTLIDRTKDWFVDSNVITFMKARVHTPGSKNGTIVQQIDGVDVTMSGTTSDFSSYKQSILKMGSMVSIDVVRLCTTENIDREDKEEYLRFVAAVLLTLEITRTDFDTTKLEEKRTVYTNAYLKKLREISIIDEVREKQRRVQNLDAITAITDLKNLYQKASDENLDIFNCMFDEDVAIRTAEMVNLGTTLMKEGNELRKRPGITQPIKVNLTTGKNIPVYFPKSEDKIGDAIYSYPRAAIHTGRVLAKRMAEEKMCSALGLSIGWGQMMDNKTQDLFFKLLPDEVLAGLDDMKTTRVIFPLVSIPRIRPHKHLEITQAESLIFVLFSMINDGVIARANENMRARGHISSTFTSDTCSKLSNCGVSIPNLDSYSRAFKFAIRACFLGIKRKGVTRADVNKWQDNVSFIMDTLTREPEKYKNDEMMDSLSLR